MSSFTATIWGARGGRPVPGRGTSQFGGNTTCLEVRAGPHLIVVDAGTGIIGLGAKLTAQRDRDSSPIVGTLLFTHGHPDHTQGLPFFKPLRFEDSIFHILGPRMFGYKLDDMIQRIMQPPNVPDPFDALPGIRSVAHVEMGDVILLTQTGCAPVVDRVVRQRAYVPPWAARIYVYHSASHPSGGTHGYRFEYGDKSLVFATDTEGYVGGDTLLARFAKGADLVILDAEYTPQEYAGPPSRQGWGHNTWRMAVDVGQKAEVKRLALTHHNMDHEDAFLSQVEEEARAVFPAAFVAREGTTIEL